VRVRPCRFRLEHRHRTIQADPQISTPYDVAREKAAELEDQPRISKNSTLVRDPASGHHIHKDNPKLVATAIEEVVTAATKGTKLAGTL
jgi:pimeloyl-ACP methyl ester carboxylesterase